MSRGQKLSLLLNIPYVQARQKIEKLQSTTVNANTIYDLVLTTTEDINKAEEAYTEWVEARIHAGKDPYGSISLDGIGIAQAIGELFGGKQSSIDNKGHGEF